MTRLEQYHFLCCLGNGLTIPWKQLIELGSAYMANPQLKVRYDIRITKRQNGKSYYSWEVERMLKDALENGLVKQIEPDGIRQRKLQNSYVITPQEYSYKISPKGDECLRMEQIARAGDYSFYHNFDGTVDSAKKINPELFK